MNAIYTVLRAAGERSLPLAEKALQQETSNYTVIEEFPFSSSLKKMFSIGKEVPFRYLLALDADVILHPGIFAKIAQEAEKCAFFLDFFVMDKFRGKCCSGCHLYSNQYSEALLEYSLEGNPSRPENDLILNFSKENHLKHGKSSLVVGLHDYEQYYRDLYAKFYRRAQRRREEAEQLITVLEARRVYFPNDPDFEVALKGLKEGMKGEKALFSLFDARTYPPIEQVMPLLEKLPLKR